MQTLQNWEQDRRRPPWPAAALLSIIEHDPLLAVKAIPTALVIYKSGRAVRRIDGGMMIHKWAFLDRGSRIAVSSGTVHGMTRIHLTLYDSRTGKALRTWDGNAGEAPPEWGAEVSR